MVIRPRCGGYEGAARLMPNWKNHLGFGCCRPQGKGSVRFGLSSYSCLGDTSSFGVIGPRPLFEENGALHQYNRLQREKETIEYGTRTFAIPRRRIRSWRSRRKRLVGGCWCKLSHVLGKHCSTASARTRPMGS
jgi:hypothetical protein